MAVLGQRLCPEPVMSVVSAGVSTFKSFFWDTGLRCAAVASVIFSVSALQVKLTGGRVPVLELCVVRSSISLCTSLSLGVASRIQPLLGHRQRLPLLFLRGLFGTCAITCSYIALLNLPLGDAVTLAQLRPPVMAVMGALLLGEPLGWIGAAACLISLFGAVIISHPPFLFGGHADWGHHRLLGTLCGMASPCFGAGAGYCIRRIQKTEPALVVALWFHLVTVGVLMWPLIAGFPQAPVLVSAADAGLLVGIAASSFCAQLLMTRAFQLLPAARASALSFMGVVYSHALGALVFGEKLTLSTLAGGLLVFAGVLLVALRGSNSSSGGGPDAAKATGSNITSGSSTRNSAEETVPLKQQHQGKSDDNPGPRSVYADQQQPRDQQQQHLVADTALQQHSHLHLHKQPGHNNNSSVAGATAPAVDVELGSVHSEGAFAVSGDGSIASIHVAAGTASGAGAGSAAEMQLQPPAWGSFTLSASGSSGLLTPLASEPSLGSMQGR